MMMQNCSLSPTVKNLNFKNPKWRMTAILQTVKSAYLQTTDFDEIWQDGGFISLFNDFFLRFLMRHS